MCERERQQQALAEKKQALWLSTSGSSSWRSLSVPSYRSKLWKVLAYKTTVLFPVTVVEMGLLDWIFPLGCLTPGSGCRTPLLQRLVSHCSGDAQLLVTGQSTGKAHPPKHSLAEYHHPSHQISRKLFCFFLK